MPSLATYNIATCLFTCFCFDIVFFCFCFCFFFRYDDESLNYNFSGKTYVAQHIFHHLKVGATKIYLQMLTNAMLSYLFMRKTATAKTNQDRIVVLAKPVFLKMNKLTQVKKK